jgi:hypothetical protein
MSAPIKYYTTSPKTLPLNNGKKGVFNGIVLLFGVVALACKTHSCVGFIPKLVLL